METNRTNGTGKTGFDAYDNAVEIARAMRPIVDRIREHDRSLADEGKRATQSIGLNVAEAWRRAGRDRAHAFRIALGSAGEARAVVEQADAWGYLDAGSAGHALGLLDRE